jgi:hypothetical protein
MHAKGMPDHWLIFGEIIDAECDFASAEAIRIGEAVAGTLPGSVLVQVAMT